MNDLIQVGEKISMLKALSDGLVKLARKHRNLVVLHADFGTKIGLRNFYLAFPERCFNFGLSEENVVAAAVGFAARGKIPFVIGFSNFAGKAWEQIRSSVCYPNLNIKFIATNAGISSGEDGVGYQPTEDVAIMRSIPNMKVVSPVDYHEAMSALEQSFDSFGPVYMRLSSKEVPVVLSENYKFEFGKAKVLKEGIDACVFTHGALTSNVLEAAMVLEDEGKSIMVVDVASVKPVDVEKIIECSKKVKKCLVVEDNNLNGGLFSVVAEVLVEKNPVFLKGIGLKDRFGESGSMEDLYKKYGFDVAGLGKKIRELL
ncbi:MAG: transketolase C-terminal domain-containing protein [Candidatus Gracilibacteria bacterium]